MSHRVYLDASPFRRMPNGEAGEWQVFRDHEGGELEAKNGAPLLWWCLFASKDLLRARLIDNEDLGSEGREDLLDSMGDSDLTYPYLVTSQEEALHRLHQRKEQTLAAIGQDHAPVYDAFVQLIDRHLKPFVLLQTSDLPDVEDIEPWLLQITGEMEAFDTGAPLGPALASMTEEIRRARPADALWMMSGSSFDGIWPPPELAPRRSSTYDASDSDGLEASAQRRQEVSARSWSRRAESLVEWAGGIVAAACGLAAFFYLSSMLAGIIAFLAAALAIGLSLSRLQRRSRKDGSARWGSATGRWD